MTKDILNFTAFTDETGSITDGRSEVFGGSVFLIEDSEIDKCRSFLKERYPSGIHCSDCEKNTLLGISKEVGSFLKNKNCLAITSLQINEHLIRDCKLICENQRAKKMNVLKRYTYYSDILRSIFLGIYSLAQTHNFEQIEVRIVIEDFARKKTLDHWGWHSSSFKDSQEKYKKLIPDVKEFMENNVEYVDLEYKKKKEELMFSFPDIFAYAVRKIVTHSEYSLYENLKPIFDKCYSGYCSDSNLFNNHQSNGVFIQFFTAENLFSASQLTELEWTQGFNNLV